MTEREEKPQGNPPAEPAGSDQSEATPDQSPATQPKPTKPRQGGHYSHRDRRQIPFQGPEGSTPPKPSQS